MDKIGLNGKHFKPRQLNNVRKEMHPAFLKTRPMTVVFLTCGCSIFVTLKEIH